MSCVEGRFEYGKYYIHPNGKCRHIIGTAHTLKFGYCFIAEIPEDAMLLPVSMECGGLDGFVEVSHTDGVEYFEATENR